MWLNYRCVGAFFKVHQAVVRKFALLLLSAASGLAAQPKIGLALSGGGAKGFAHIGAMEIIDSLGIPIHIVSGTSMGAVVGGLYAIGYTPGQIENVVRRIDWNELMTSEPRRLHRPYLQRSVSDRHILGLKLANNKVLIPSGFINGQKIYAELSLYTQGFHGRQNFLDFPRPFVCVATELNTGRERVFTNGLLVDAMRASMAIPSVFKPYKIGRHYFLDGGVVNNFPADKLKDMGADIILGIDVQTTISDTMTRPTVANIVEKTIMYVNFKTTAEREAMCNLIIKPNMMGYGVSDFSQHETLIERGREEARRHIPQLLHLKDSIENLSTNNIKVYQPLPDTLFIKHVELQGRKNVDIATIKGLMNIREQSYTTKKNLEQRLPYLYGTGFFDQVSYQLHPLSGDSVILEFNMREAESDGSLNLGLRYDQDFGIGILLNYQRRNILFMGSMLNADVVMGETPRFSVDYHFNRGVIPGLGISTRGIISGYNVYAENKFQGRAGDDDIQTRIYWQATALNHYNYGGFIEHHFSALNYRRVPGLNDILSERNLIRNNYHHLNVGLFFRTDRMDRTVYPHHGRFNDVSIRLVDPVYKSNNQQPARYFLNINTQARWAYEISDGWVLQPNASLVMSFFNTPTVPYAAFLGGVGGNYFNNQLPFVGFRYRELGTTRALENDNSFFRNNAAAIGLDVQYNLQRNTYITALINVGNIAKRPSGFFTDPEWLVGYGVKVGFLSIAGPIELTIHRNTSTGSIFGFFNFGYWF